MKKILLALVIVAALLNSGCQACRALFKDIKSETIGVSRQVILYDCYGKAIGKWDSNTTMTVEGGSATWIDDTTGKRITVSGTFTVIEN